jgi:hypothetical protein
MARQLRIEYPGAIYRVVARVPSAARPPAEGVSQQILTSLSGGEKSWDGSATTD